MNKYLISALVLLVSGCDVRPQVDEFSFTQESVFPVTRETVSITDVLSLKNVKPVPSSTPSRNKELLHLSINPVNTVFISDAIGDEALETAKKITALSQTEKEIYILINSPGGSVIDGAQIISAMEASKVPVYTVCLEICASMAAMIHSYGVKRYAVDRSILMYHPAAGGLRGTLEQMQSQLTMISRYVNKMDAYISKRSGIPYEKFKSMTVSELWLDAEDALQKNLVDRIVNVNLHVSFLPGLQKSSDNLKKLKSGINLQ